MFALGICSSLPQISCLFHSLILAWKSRWVPCSSCSRSNVSAGVFEKDTWGTACSLFKRCDATQKLGKLNLQQVTMQSTNSASMPSSLPSAHFPLAFRYFPFALQLPATWAAWVWCVGDTINARNFGACFTAISVNELLVEVGWHKLGADVPAGS